jgi:hypothetical protein
MAERIKYLLSNSASSERCDTTENDTPSHKTLWDFNSHDVCIDTFKLKEKTKYSIDDKKRLIPKNTLIGETHFTPLDKDSYSPEIRSIAVWYLYKGLSDFINHIDSQDTKNNKKIPTLLYGTTNQEMAAFAARFGFKILDEPILDGDGYVNVIAKVSVLRKKLTEISQTEINGKKLTDLLKNRSDRELMEFSKNEYEKQKRNLLINTSAAIGVELMAALVFFGYTLNNNELPFSAINAGLGLYWIKGALKDAKNYNKRLGIIKTRLQTPAQEE